MQNVYEQGKLEFINLLPGLPEPVTNILYIAALIGLGVVFVKYVLPVANSLVKSIGSIVSAIVAILFILLIAHNMGLIDATPVFNWLAEIFPAIAKKG